MSTTAKTVTAAVLMGLAALAPTAASAEHWRHDDAAWADGRYRPGDIYRGGGYYEGGYYGRETYRPHRHHRSDRRYAGYRCDRGTGGTILGAIAGGLIANEVTRGRGGDRDAAVILGAGLGALTGRAIDRDC